jgi:hypothetical protein
MEALPFSEALTPNVPTNHIPEVRNLQGNLTTAIKEKDVYMPSKITK